uniref:Uncharacterized protein n=1 Tax=Arundo donax TaxID=35708 RepID=A0A0A9D4S7_ARUDO
MDTQESDQYSHIYTKLANICSLQGTVGLDWPLLWMKGTPHLSA